MAEKRALTSTSDALERFRRSKKDFSPPLLDLLVLLKKLSLDGGFTFREAGMRVRPGDGPKLHDEDHVTGEMVVSKRLVSAQLSPRDRLSPPCFQLVEAVVELYAEKTDADKTALSRELNALYEAARTHCEAVKKKRVEDALKAGRRAPTYAELQAKERAITELREKVEICDAELTRLREQVSDLHDARNEQVLRITALTEELIDLRRRLAEAVTERNVMLEEREHTITELRDVVESRDAELTRLREQVGGLRVGRHEQARRIKALTEELIDLREQLAVALGALQRSRSLERKLRHDLVRSEHRVLRAVAESDQQQARIAEFEDLEDRVERERREHAARVWQDLVTDSDQPTPEPIPAERVLLKLKGVRPRVRMRSEIGLSATAALGCFALGTWGLVLFMAAVVVRCLVYLASIPVVTIRADDLLISRFYKNRAYSWREIGEISQVGRPDRLRRIDYATWGDFRIESRDRTQLDVISGGLREWEAFTTIVRTLAPHIVLIQGRPTFGRVSPGGRSLMAARACVHELEKNRTIIERRATWVENAPELPIKL